MSIGKPLLVNGWTPFAHPIFLDQLDALTAQVEAFKRKGLASSRCLRHEDAGESAKFCY